MKTLTHELEAQPEYTPFHERLNACVNACEAMKQAYLKMAETTPPSAGVLAMQFEALEKCARRAENCGMVELMGIKNLFDRCAYRAEKQFRTTYTRA